MGDAPRLLQGEHSHLPHINPHPQQRYIDEFPRFKVECLRKWKTTKQTEASHLFFDGGKMRVPPEALGAFHQDLAAAMRRGEPWYGIEVRKSGGKLYNMLAELDFKRVPETRYPGDDADPVQKREWLIDGSLTGVDIDAITNTMQSVMRRVYGRQVDLSVAITTAAPKLAKATLFEEGEVNVVQSGVHYVWRVPVNDDRARALAAGFAEALNDSRFVPHCVGTWAEAIDQCVYDANGLRHIGARKAMVCPGCSGRSARWLRKPDKPSADFCDKCHAAGKLDLGRPYMPRCIVDADGAVMAAESQRFREDLVYALDRNMIFIPGQPKDAVPQEVLPDMEQQMRAWLRTVKSKKARGKPWVPADDPTLDRRPRAEGKQEMEYADIDSADEKFAATQTFLHEKMLGMPRIQRLKKSVGGRHTKDDCVYIATSTCRYCENKNGEHGSNTVYYVITVDGAYQKCWSKKTPVGSECCCGDFRGRKYRLSANLLAALFSKVARVRNNKLQEAIASMGGPPPSSAKRPRSADSGSGSGSSDSDGEGGDSAGEMADVPARRAPPRKRRASDPPARASSNLSFASMLDLAQRGCYRAMPTTPRQADRKKGGNPK